MSQTVIKIFGKPYALRKTGSLGELEGLGELLNERMIETARRLNSVDPLTVTLVTALNILEENEKIKARMSRATSV